MARQPISDADGRCLRIGEGARSACAATLFACGAGDENRARTVSLGNLPPPVVRAPWTVSHVVPIDLC